MRELTEAEIRKLITDYIRITLEDDERSRVMEEDPLPQDVHEEELMGYESIIDEWKKDLADCNYENAGKMVNRLLSESGLTLAPESYSFRKLCREILKADIGISEALKKREVGDYQDEQPSSAPFSPTILSPADSETSELFSTVMQKYIAEQERGGKWTEKSKVEVSKSLELIMNLLGDIPVKSITRTMMNECKENLLRLPANMGKLPQYRGKTVQELLQMNIDKPMSVSNVNKQLDRASSLFNWARINGFMDRNPAERIQVSVKTREDEDRNAFSKGDLDKLFSSPEYLECTHRQSYQFWIPILGLFTGARLDELCQLHLDDIREEEGVWLLDINDKDEKKLKNKSSRRVIPMHPFLAHELKLPQYAEKLRAQEHDRLFPELARGRDGYSKYVSKWFTGYRRQCGISEKGKAFHSFRHTFVNNLKQNATVEGVLISELAGHEVESITMGRYGKRYSPKVLLEQGIMKLNFNLDLSHLKRSRFVRGE